MKFWADYGNSFLVMLEQTENDLSSLNAKSWLERMNIPSYAVINDMYPKLSASKQDYQRTKVFAACVPAPKSVRKLIAFNFADHPDPEFHRNCSNKEILLEVFC